MKCMSCSKPVPSTHDLCDACFSKQSTPSPGGVMTDCLVCKAPTISRTGACLNLDCKRNDLSLRSELPSLTP